MTCLGHFCTIMRWSSLADRCPSLMCRWWSSRPTRTTALSPLRPSMSSHWMTWQQVGTVDIGLSCLYLLQVWPPPPLVCGFEAFINGKHIIGEVKEKEQAHREYREAISKGHGAYLMDEETPVSGKLTHLTATVTPALFLHALSLLLSLSLSLSRLFSLSLSLSRSFSLSLSLSLVSKTFIN